ncbi:MAG TPA: hypothetical protein VGR35_21670 [Tepidisphaeraceae bacterium]|nr:hypothetical protein [Tepidisphaeraceae bacterium]
MPRGLAIGLTLLSAVVCVLSLMLVVRSTVRGDMLELRLSSTTTVGAVTLDGQALLWRGRYSSNPRSFYNSQDAASLRPRQDEIWDAVSGIPWLGVGWGIAAPHYVVILPLWLLPLLTAIAPVRWWRRRRGERGRGFGVVVSAGVTSDAHTSSGRPVHQQCDRTVGQGKVAAGEVFLQRLEDRLIVLRQRHPARGDVVGGAFDAGAVDVGERGGGFRRRAW